MNTKEANDLIEKDPQSAFTLINKIQEKVPLNLNIHRMYEWLKERGVPKFIIHLTLQRFKKATATEVAKMFIEDGANAEDLIETFVKKLSVSNQDALEIINDNFEMSIEEMFELIGRVDSETSAVNIILDNSSGESHDVLMGVKFAFLIGVIRKKYDKYIAPQNRDELRLMSTKEMAKRTSLITQRSELLKETINNKFVTEEVLKVAIMEDKEILSFLADNGLTIQKVIELYGDNGISICRKIKTPEETIFNRLVEIHGFVNAVNIYFADCNSALETAKVIKSTGKSNGYYDLAKKLWDLLPNEEERPKIITSTICELYPDCDKFSNFLKEKGLNKRNITKTIYEVVGEKVIDFLMELSSTPEERFSLLNEVITDEKSNFPEKVGFEKVLHMGRAFRKEGWNEKRVANYFQTKERFSKTTDAFKILTDVLSYNMSITDAFFELHEVGFNVRLLGFGLKNAFDLRDDEIISFLHPISNPHEILRSLREEHHNIYLAMDGIKKVFDLSTLQTIQAYENEYRKQTKIDFYFWCIRLGGIPHGCEDYMTRYDFDELVARISSSSISDDDLTQIIGHLKLQPGQQIQLYNKIKSLDEILEKMKITPDKIKENLKYFKTGMYPAGKLIYYLFSNHIFTLEESIVMVINTYGCHLAVAKNLIEKECDDPKAFVDSLPIKPVYKNLDFEEQPENTSTDKKVARLMENF